MAVLKQTHGASAYLGELLRNSHCDEKKMPRLQKESFKHDRTVRFALKQNVSNASAFLSVVLNPSSPSPHAYRGTVLSQSKKVTT